MTVKLKFSPEPQTRASIETNTLNLADSRARQRLTKELTRYVEGKVLGRSILISGHRGSGKTTLVRSVVQEIYLENRDKQDKPRPLYIPLNGPALLAPIVYPGSKPAEEKKTDVKKEAVKEVETIEGVKTDEEGNPIVSPEKEEADPKKEEKPATAPKDLPEDVEPQPQKEQIRLGLMEMTVALYREVAAEFYDSYYRTLRSSEHWDSRSVDYIELAGQFRLELDGKPSAAMFREFWQHAGAMENGILFKSPRQPNQSVRELLALTAAAHAFGIVAGESTHKFSSSKQKELEKSRSSGGDGDSKNGGHIQNLISAMFGLGAGGLTALNSGEALAPAIVAILTALGVNFATREKIVRKNDETQSYVFDRSLKTLDRELPKLVERISDAGIIPIFVVDELDKVEDLQIKMRTLVTQLKHFVVERSFFCFLTDRDYFEDLEYESKTKAYPIEHTYFSRRLFISYLCSDLHDYLNKQITVSTEEGMDTVENTSITDNNAKELLPFIAIYESKMHMFDLMKNLSKYFDIDGDLRKGIAGEVGTLQKYKTKWQVQIAIELVLRSKKVNNRIADDAQFAQLVYDTLYYLSRMQEQGTLDGINTSKDSLIEHLHGRMKAVNGNSRPKEGAQSVNNENLPKNDEGETKPGALKKPISDSDLKFLKDCLDELLTYLSDPNALPKALSKKRTTSLDTPATPDPDTNNENTLAWVPAVVMSSFDSRWEPLIGKVPEKPDTWNWLFDSFTKRSLPEIGSDSDAESTSESERSQTGDSHSKQTDVVSACREHIKSIDKYLSEQTGNTVALSTLADPLGVISSTPSWRVVGPLVYGSNETLSIAQKAILLEYTLMLLWHNEAINRAVIVAAFLSKASGTPESQKLSAGFEALNLLKLTNEETAIHRTESIQSLMDKLVQEFAKSRTGTELDETVREETESDETVRDETGSDETELDELVLRLQELRGLSATLTSVDAQIFVRGISSDSIKSTQIITIIEAAKLLLTDLDKIIASISSNKSIQYDKPVQTAWKSWYQYFEDEIKSAPPQRALSTVLTRFEPQIEHFVCKAAGTGPSSTTLAHDLVRMRLKDWSELVLDLYLRDEPEKEMLESLPKFMQTEQWLTLLAMRMLNIGGDGFLIDNDLNENVVKTVFKSLTSSNDSLGYDYSWIHKINMQKWKTFQKPDFVPKPRRTYIILGNENSPMGRWPLARDLGALFLTYQQWKDVHIPAFMELEDAVLLEEPSEITGEQKSQELSGYDSIGKKAYVLFDYKGYKETDFLRQRAVISNPSSLDDARRILRRDLRFE